MQLLPNLRLGLQMLPLFFDFDCSNFTRMNVCTIKLIFGRSPYTLASYELDHADIVFMYCGTQSIADADYIGYVPSCDFYVGS